MYHMRKLLVNTELAKRVTARILIASVVNRPGIPVGRNPVLVGASQGFSLSCRRSNNW